MIATAAAGAGMSTAKFFEGRSMQKKAEKFIENFEYQDLENPYEDLQVSTLGSELMTEQANIGAATSVEALRNAGTRALVGGLGRVEANRNNINREVAVNLDEQQKVIDRAKAQQDVENQKMIERRQAEELAGYGQMMNVGMGMKHQGMSDFVNSVGAFGQAASGMSTNNTPQVSSVSSLSSAGMAPTANALPTASLPWMK